MIDEVEVEEVFRDCFYPKENLVDNARIPRGAIVIQGAMFKYALDPLRVVFHKQSIIDWLSQLSPKYQNKGGFLLNRTIHIANGDKWTISTLKGEQLIVLGIAIGVAKLIRQPFGSRPFVRIEL